MTTIAEADAMPCPVKRQVIPTTVLVGLVGLLFGVAVAMRNLPVEGWDPTVFIGFGDEATATLDYGRERLGDVVVRKAQGHDGKFFFVQANDPLYLDPEVNAAVLDRPGYRAQRMLYPLMAGGFGLFSPLTIAWAMLVINVASLGAGSWATAVYACNEGWSPWWGLTFGLNIGMISEMTIGGAGILAFAAAMGALAAVQRGRQGWAATGFTAAVLSREAMILMVVGAAFWWWRHRGRIPWLWAVTPVAAAALWAGYLRARLADLPADGSSIQEIGLPLVGFSRAFQLWGDRPVSLITGVAVLGVSLLFALRTLHGTRLLAWSALGFVPLALLFTRQVWFSYFDITRAVAPVLTAWVIVTFARNDERHTMR